jgi:hypothetical protein
MSILLGFPAADATVPFHRCRSAYDGTVRALRLWITSCQGFGCGQLFAICKMMQEDTPRWAVLAVLVILAVRGSPYETRAASDPQRQNAMRPD